MCNLTNELIENSVQTGEGAEDLCTWCDRSLGYAKMIYKTVCFECYDRLETANIDDSEIFEVG